MMETSEVLQAEEKLFLALTSAAGFTQGTAHLRTRPTASRIKIEAQLTRDPTWPHDRQSAVLIRGEWFAGGGRNVLLMPMVAIGDCSYNGITKSVHYLEDEWARGIAERSNDNA
jgi:hypothetical protein